MAFNFWKLLFGLHRKSDEGPNKKTTTKPIYNIYILLSSVIYSLSKIVILHGLLESPYTTKCYQLLVCRVLTIKKQ